MDQFDDMLRNNMANPAPETRFEFREEYWQQAERLLEADERRRRRGLLFWWSGLGAVALAGALWVFWPQDASPNPMPASQPPAPVEKVMALAPAHSKPLVSAPQKNMPTQATESQNTVSNSLYNYNRQHQTKNQKNNAQLAITEQVIPESATTAGLNTSPPVAHVDNPVSAPAPKAIFYDHTSNVAVETSPTLMMPAAQVLLPSGSLKEVSSTSPLPAIQFTKASENTPIPVKIHKTVPRLQMGLLASVGTPSGLFDVEQPGLALGGTARYRLNRHFSLNADLVWRRWKGQNFDNSSLQPGLTTNHALDAQYLSNNLATYTVRSDYGFGVTNVRAAIERQSLHLLELPLALQWHFRQFTLEGGISTSLVMATRSELQEYTSGSFNHTERLAREKAVWNTYTGLKRWQNGGFAGVSWEPSRRWNVGVRAWYQTARMSAENSPEKAGAVVSTSSSNWLPGIIDARVRFFF